MVCRIVKLRHAHPSWGASKLRAVLARTMSAAALPSESSFKRILDKAGLVVHRRRVAVKENSRIQLRVRAERPEARFLLKHPQSAVPPGVKDAIDRLGLHDAVTVLGSVPASQFPDVYRAADVVVSIPSSDSSPRSVWEALACGRPVIVSDLPWAREELMPEEQALLVPTDAEAVARAIGRLLDDDDLARLLGVNGRALAAEELDPAACAARIDSVYRGVVEGRP